MKLFKLDRISFKLICGVSIVVIMTLAQGFFNLQSMDQLAEMTNKMYRHPFAVSNAVLRIDTDIMAMHRSMKDVALAKNIEQIKAASEIVDSYEKEALEEFEIINERFLGDKSMVEEALQSFKDWEPIRAEVIALMGEGKLEEAAAITKGKGARHVALLTQNMEGLIEFASHKGEAFYQNSQSTDEKTHNLTIILMISITVAGILVAFWLQSSVKKNLKVVVSKICRRAEEVTGAAAQLSSSTQTQSASVEEISASLEELIASIQDVAQNANRVSSTAHNSAEQAVSGGQAVQKSIEAMNRISDSSKKIGEIIGVITKIADKTDLLALNAAIEASRAGEHGQGFDVVADEVRKLAESSAKAAQQITQLIEESSERVEEGMELSNQAGNVLTSIIEHVNNTADMVEQISAATEEQAATSNAIKDGMNQISNTVTQNSAASEEMASSAQSMLQEILVLNNEQQHSAPQASVSQPVEKKIEAIPTVSIPQKSQEQYLDW